MAEVRFIDTTIRDGQQSLWAMNMRTRHMVPALTSIDAAGYDQIELMAATVAFKKLVRHLHEDPWDWITSAVATARRTPLRWHGFDNTLSGPLPLEVAALLMSKAVELGIRHSRIGDNWNRLELLREKKDLLERIGMTPTVNVMYSVSARHTDTYFVERAKQAAAIEPFRICFKDVGGLLTPERARDLLPKLLAQTGDIPWEFHGHCNNGLGPLNALEAVRAGVRYVHTAVPPLANGNSQPSISNVARNLRALGHDARIDLEALTSATEHLTDVAEREGFAIGAPVEYRERQYRHQIPGGMISNLEYQLRQAGLADRLEETLEEVAQVRAEFGYPIMVTPLSQFVGSQAAINVMLGDRYREVSDDVIHYAWGRHGGDEAIAGMDPEVRAKILDRPRARELEHADDTQPTLKELRHRYGETISDEDLILCVLVGDDAPGLVAAMGPAASADGLAGPPLVTLLRRLTQGSDHRRVTISKGALTLTVQRGADRTSSDRRDRGDRQGA